MSKVAVIILYFICGNAAFGGMQTMHAEKCRQAVTDRDYIPILLAWPAALMISSRLKDLCK